MDKDISQKRLDGTIAHLSSWIFPVLLFLAAVVVRVAFVANSSGDFNYFLSHWFEHFSVYGWDGFLKPPGNYSMAYLFLLGIAAQLPGAIPDIIRIKAISVFFDVVLALSAKNLVQIVLGDERRAWRVFFAVLFLPTVFLNSAAWGQCDSIYVSFIMFGLGSLLLSKWGKAVFFFSLAFSFKMQALFIGPFLFWMWCASGRPPLRYTFILPAVFLLTLAPASMFGADISDIIMRYPKQINAYSSVSKNAPNFYRALTSLNARVVSIAGVALTGLLCVCIGFLSRPRLKNASPSELLNWALLSLILCPFLLPRMHDRYMYAADVLSLAVAVISPRLLLVALGCQLSSLLVYLQYLFGYGTRLDAWVGVPAGIACLLLARSLYMAQPVPSTCTVPSSANCSAPRYQLLLPSLLVILFVELSAFQEVPRGKTLGIKIVSANGDVQRDVLNADRVYQSYGEPRPRKNMDNSPLELDGSKEVDGFGVHANSILTFHLGGGYDRLEGYAATPPYLRAEQGSLRFLISLDGVAVWDSGLLKGPNNHVPFSVSVAGKDLLVLSVSDNGDGDRADHACWIEPKLLRR